MTRHLSAYIVNAVKKGNIKAVRCYLKLHANNDNYLNATEKERYGITFYSTSGWNYDSLPHIAIRYNRIDILKELVDCDPIVLTIRNRSLDTPLTLAIKFNNLAAIQALLIDSSVVDHVANGYTGETGLFLAAQMGRADIVRVLLEHGANKNHKNVSGNTAEYEARTWGHTEIADLIHSYQQTEQETHTQTSQSCKM